LKIISSLIKNGNDFPKLTQPHKLFQHNLIFTNFWAFFQKIFFNPDEFFSIENVVEILMFLWFFGLQNIILHLCLFSLKFTFLIPGKFCGMFWLSHEDWPKHKMAITWLQLLVPAQGKGLSKGSPGNSLDFPEILIRGSKNNNNNNLVQYRLFRC